MIDLHTHTNCSDGSSSPEELLHSAKRVGLRALAITDHDTLAGFDAALPFAGRCGVELVCGIELSTRFESDSGQTLSMHMLGYFPARPPGDEFRNWLMSISSTRRQRNLALMERLQTANINISWNDFPDLGPERAARPHFARVLVEKGCVPDIQGAFDLYLNDSALAGIERELPAAQQAIQRIHREGGVASLAHPGRLGCGHGSALESIVGELAGHGMIAIESYHSDHTTEETAALLQIAARLGLLVTGGSDFHGENKPGIELGSGRSGNVCVPDEVLEKIRGVCADEIDCHLPEILI